MDSLIDVGDKAMTTVLFQLKGKGKLAVRIPSNSISPRGTEVISEYLRTIHLPPLPTNWSWEWVVQKGDFAGTFPKRVANYMRKVHKIKIEPQIISEIGNKARAHAEDRNIYVVDFTNEFNWHDGDFGDGDSCFWGANSEALVMLKNHNSFAIRFWEPETDGLYYTTTEIENDEPGFYPPPDYRDYCDCHSCVEWRLTHGLSEEKRKLIAQLSDKTSRALELAEENGFRDLVGSGRAWLIPDQPEPGMLLTINAYPPNFRLIRVARILATTLGLSYKKIDLKNIEQTSGKLYINGGTAYLIGLPGAIDAYNEHDLMWEIPGYGSCSSCGSPLNYPEYESHGRSYCMRCARSLLKTCDRCGYMGLPDSMHHLEIADAQETGFLWLCNDCFSHYTHCSSCNEFMERRYLYRLDGQEYCRSCYLDLQVKESSDNSQMPYVRVQVVDQPAYHRILVYFFTHDNKLFVQILHGSDKDNFIAILSQSDPNFVREFLNLTFTDAEDMTAMLPEDLRSGEWHDIDSYDELANGLQYFAFSAENLADAIRQFSPIFRGWRGEVEEAHTIRRRPWPRPGNLPNV
jgi:hypothetical protein